MSATYVGPSCAAFGTGHRVERINNLPAGAKYEVHQHNNEFVTATVVLASGRVQLWVLGQSEEPGVWSLWLEQADSSQGGAFYHWCVQVYCTPVRLLHTLAWPLRVCYHWLRSDWLRYRDEMDNLCNSK